MISCHGLTKDFGMFRALDGIDFDLHDSRIFGVVGHNGAGKTTLLKIMAGLVRPTAGELSIDGIDVIRESLVLKEKLGYLPEESRLYDTMTVDGYLTFFGEIYHLNREVVEEKKGVLLSSLSLNSSGKKIGDLSKGMKRKVAIARSLLHNPSILIYDEPTTGLDPMTSRFIIDYLKTLSDQKKTIILSAHNLFQVEEICDTILILRRGKIAGLGTMRELREMFGSIKYTVYYTPNVNEKSNRNVINETNGNHAVVHADSIDTLNKLIANLAAQGSQIDRIESHYPTLEEMLFKVGT